MVPITNCTKKNKIRSKEADPSLIKTNILRIKYKWSTGRNTTCKENSTSASSATNGPSMFKTTKFA